MAQVYGKSGAWTDIQTPLKCIGLYPDTPDDLRALVPQLEKDWNQSEIDALDAFNLTTRELTDLVSLKRAEYVTALAALQTKHTYDIAELDQRLSPEGKISTARQMQRWFLWGPLKLRRLYLQKQHARRAIDLEKLPLHTEAILQNHINSQHHLVESYRQPFRKKLDGATAALESKEYAGAVAEIDVLRHLESLPDSFTVLADVRLEYNRYLYYEGEHLKTAQIDYVVVGPPGVYLIEVKLWSRNFTDSGNFHDPYKQVARASYLCYRMLKEAGMETKLRTIIATRSSLPPKPAKSYAKVLTPSALCGYINYFPEKLGVDQVDNLVHFFWSKC